jgi:acyl-CoA dehydrogenase
MGMIMQCIVIEELARVDPVCAAILSTNALTTSAPLAGGSEEQKKRYLSKLAKGELGAYALTEPEHGSDAAHMETTAALIGNEYVLNGTKCFISQFDVANLVVIFARTNPKVKPSKGISCFVLEKKPELDIPEIINAKQMAKMTQRALHTFEFTMKDLRIPKENLIGAEGDGFRIAMQALDSGGRLGCSGTAVGIAQGAFDEAVKYAKSRIAFGKPIGEFQAVQFKLSDMATQIEAARQLMYMAAYNWDMGGPNATIYGSMAKLFAADIAMNVTTEVAGIFGGYGVLFDYQVGQRMLDAKIFQIVDGTPEIQRLVIGRRIMEGWPEDV